MRTATSSATACATHASAVASLRRAHLHRALRAAETPCEQPPQGSLTHKLSASPPAALLSTRLTCRLAPHRRQHERTNDKMAPTSTRATARAPTKWMPAGLAHDDKYVAHTTYPNSTSPTQP